MRNPSLRPDLIAQRMLVQFDLPQAGEPKGMILIASA
jgi:hypothetical protein